MFNALYVTLYISSMSVGILWLLFLGISGLLEILEIIWKCSSFLRILGFISPNQVFNKIDLGKNFVIQVHNECVDQDLERIAPNSFCKST